MLSLYAASSAFSGSAACSDDEGCNLNGRCAAGTCHCLSAWGGPDCGKLSLQPASRSAGLHAPGGSSPNTSSCGGAVAYDPTSQRWQMFAAEMVGGCGINAWEANSRVVRASSATAGGEYVVEEEIKPHLAHEPMLARVGASWLLYSIGGNGSTPSGPKKGCRDGYTCDPEICGAAPSFSGAVPVEVYESASLLGPWNRSLAPVGEGDLNPAPLVFPNGSTVMMWRGGDAWLHVHLARSARWDVTPYAFCANQTDPDRCSGTLFPGLDRHGIEDPFLYVQVCSPIHRPGARSLAWQTSLPLNRCYSPRFAPHADTAAPVGRRRRRHVPRRLPRPRQVWRPRLLARRRLVDLLEHRAV